MFTQRGEVCNRLILSPSQGQMGDIRNYIRSQLLWVLPVPDHLSGLVMDKYCILRTKVILTRTMELSIIGMWCISSVSINSCDVVGISISTVSALHQSLWVVGTGQI